MRSGPGSIDCWRSKERKPPQHFTGIWDYWSGISVGWLESAGATGSASKNTGIARGVLGKCAGVGRVWCETLLNEPAEAESIRRSSTPTELRIFWNSQKTGTGIPAQQRIVVLGWMKPFFSPENDLFARRTSGRWLSGSAALLRSPGGSDAHRGAKGRCLRSPRRSCVSSSTAPLRHWNSVNRRARDRR
jgi:hypothetical protein